MTSRHAGLFGLATMLMALATTAGAADLIVREAWARATPPGAGVAAVYLTLVGGDAADRLVKVTTDRATMTEVHEVSDVNGMARMRPAGVVDVEPHATVKFAPNGLHLMLMNLAAPLVAGQRFTVTLMSAHAGARNVEVAVIAPDQPPPAARR